MDVSSFSRFARGAFTSIACFSFVSLTASADTGVDQLIPSVPVIVDDEPIALPSDQPQSEPRTLLDDLTPEPIDLDPQILQSTTGPAESGSSPILIPAIPAALSGGVALLALSSFFRRIRRFIA